MLHMTGILLPFASWVLDGYHPSVLGVFDRLSQFAIIIGIIIIIIHGIITTSVNIIVNTRGINIIQGITAITTI